MAQAMTPHDALHALGDLPRYEERLTARAFGMTAMSWAVAVAGLFMTYTAAGPLLERNGVEWLYSLLWLPWVAAGNALTFATWHSQAISLRRKPEGGKGLLIAAAYTAGFFAVMLASLFVIEVVLDQHFVFNLEMVFVTGLFTVAIGLAQRKAHPGGPLLLLNGVLVAALALALIPYRLRHDTAGVLGAGVVGLAWFLPGLYSYIKG